MEPSSVQHDRPTDLVERYFTNGVDTSRPGGGVNPFNGIPWKKVTAQVGDFRQEGVTAPEFWSDNAIGVVAKLYFATVDGVREHHVGDMIRRVAGKIAMEGCKHGYFDDLFDGDVPVLGGAALDFHDELCYLLLHQMGTFNTPVWLNVGVPGRDQCCSACYLLRLEDKMLGEHSITRWWETEARIFKSGAGSGVSVAKLRGSMEKLSTGGTASGPTAYMRAADTNAGTLKSGGAHRRAAKMVINKADHPDIFDFIDTKAREDDRMRALAAAGYDVNPFTVEGEKLIAETTSFQNANHSVGASHEFMARATRSDSFTWSLRSRTTGSIVETIPAPKLLKAIADAAWKCGDPGMVFLDTVNEWHTTPMLRGEPSPITTCNPCAETWLNDNSSCNLASLNLLKFITAEGKLDLDGYRHAIDIFVLAMDITCSFSDLPTEEIERNTRELRQLGLGYSNLGAALMVLGMPYDSDAGRSWAQSMTAVLTGRAYARSAQLARAMGPYALFEENADAHRRVIAKHEQALPPFPDPGDDWYALSAVAHGDWATAVRVGNEHGYRNAQVTVIAPTGTTSYMMDCDTTGCEPGFSLITHKGLAGGGHMLVENRSVRRALERLGYAHEEIELMVEHLAHAGHLPIEGELGGAPGLREEHAAVFDCANDISPLGHVRMVTAIQPFLSGAPSKTVNLPNEATPQDILDLYVYAWRNGAKAISVYRDGSKATQVLTSKPKDQPAAEALEVKPEPRRERMPITRHAITHKYSIDGHKGYITAGTYEDGRLGEIFVTGAGKEGSFVQGMMGWGAIVTSIALQYGVPLETLVHKITSMSFEPSGPTSNPEIPSATSLPDYLMRWLASQFLDIDEQEAAGVLTAEVKTRKVARLDAEERGETLDELSTPIQSQRGLKPCPECGGSMKPTGVCYTCSCGYNTGCG